MSKTLRKLAGKSFLLRITAAGMTYIFVVALARMMSFSDFGIVGTLMSSALLFSVIGCLGQRMAILRFVPPLIDGAAGREVLVSFLSRTVRLAMIGNACIYSCLALVVCGAYFFEGSEKPNVIFLGLLIIPLMGIIDMQAHIARAYRSIILAIGPKDILWRFLSLCVILIVYLVSEAPVPLWVVLLVLVLVLFCLIVGQGYMMARLLAVPSVLKIAAYTPDKPADSEWQSSRFPFWISSVSAVLFINIDVVAAGVLIGAEEAALYFSANRIALVPSLFLVSYNVVIGPLLSTHFAANRSAELREVARSASIQVFVPTLCTVAVLMILAGPVLSLFGDQFAHGVPILRWLLLASLIGSMFGPNDLILNMCGEERRAMFASIIGITIGGGAVVFSALFGDPEILAMATCGGVALMRYLSWFMVRRSLRFSADIFTTLYLKFTNRYI